MKILILSPYPENLLDPLEEHGDTYIVNKEKIDLSFCKQKGIEFIISYGYRYRIAKDILDYLPGKVINLHISYLPYARGAHPVFWSIFESSITGVSIHLVDEGFDTGNILFQKEVDYSREEDTFLSIYKKMQFEIEKLFRMNWKYLRNSQNNGWPQQGESTSHNKYEIEEMKKYLPNMWETTIKEFFDLVDKI